MKKIASCIVLAAMFSSTLIAGKKLLISNSFDSLETLIKKKSAAEKIIKKNSFHYGMRQWCADNWKPLLYTTAITTPIVVAKTLDDGVSSWTYAIIAAHSLAGYVGYIASPIYRYYNDTIQDLEAKLNQAKKE